MHGWEKFVRRFLQDTSFKTLCQALLCQDMKEAFRAAHTLKGISQNLCFTRLQTASQALANALREGAQLPNSALFGQVEQAYRQTISAIAKLDESTL